MYEGIYHLSAVAPSWHQALVAAWFWAGEGAVVSHRAAGALSRLDGVEPGFVELTTGKPGRSPPRGILLHRSTQLPSRDLTRIGLLPATNVTRTLIDLAGVLDKERIERAIDDALRRGLTSVSRLRGRLGDLGGPGRAGTRLLRELLDARTDRAAPPESLLEARLLKLLTASGLPVPVTQYEIRAAGRVLARLDFAYPDRLVAIEADGYRYHSGRIVWQRDLERRNLLAGLGWRMVHVTWEDLALRPGEVVEILRRLTA